MKDSHQLHFVDTNIFVYAYDNTSQDKRQKAKELITALWHNGQGCLSIQVLQEFYVSTTRKINNPLLPEQASKIISDLGRWNVHVPTVNDILKAIIIQERYQLSFWDAMIICSAKQMGCGIVWTEDLSHGQQYEGMLVKNPYKL